MRLQPGRKWFSPKERLNLQPNSGEVLIGYQWIAPFDDGMDREGFTREENGWLIMNRLNSREKNSFIQGLNRKDDRPVPPAMFVPVYICKKNTSGNSEFNEWVVRTFRVEFAELYEKKHWYSAPRLVTKDYLQILPAISCYIEPENSKLESVLRHWNDLDQKSIAIEGLRELLGLSPETKTA